MENPSNVFFHCKSCMVDVCVIVSVPDVNPWPWDCADVWPLIKGIPWDRDYLPTSAFKWVCNFLFLSHRYSLQACCHRSHAFNISIGFPFVVPLFLNRSSAPGGVVWVVSAWPPSIGWPVSGSVIGLCPTPHPPHSGKKSLKDVTMVMLPLPWKVWTLVLEPGSDPKQRLVYWSNWLNWLWSPITWLTALHYVISDYSKCISWWLTQ